MKVTSWSLLNQDKRFSNECPLFLQPADVRHKCSVIMCLLPPLSSLQTAGVRWWQSRYLNAWKYLTMMELLLPSSQAPGHTRCGHNHQHRHSTLPYIPFSITADMLWWPGGLYSESVSIFVQLFATWQTIFPCLGPYSMIDNLCLQLPRILFTKWSFPNIFRQSAVPFQLTYRHDRKCRADCMQHAGANKCMKWI